jgi:hypothetical protein
VCEYLDREKNNGEKGRRAREKNKGEKGRRAAVRSKSLNREGMRLVSARE